MNTTIYQNIATRTAGDIYIGVVGPVRTGKSTFIKRFMETQVIPNIENVYRRERARDELPQSGSGRTIMTAEPKFVPEEAAQIQLEGGAQVADFFVKDSTGSGTDLLAAFEEEPSVHLKRDGSAEILIYHTHTSEAYSQSYTGFYYTDMATRTEDPDQSVVAAGEALKQALEAQGFGVVHDTTVNDTLYNGSYDRSWEVLQKNLAEYPTLQVTIDVHRDSMTTDSGVKYKPTVTVNGRKAAQVMLIAGCDANGGWGDFPPGGRKTCAWALRVQQKLQQLYPGLARPLNFSNSKYNMNATPGSMLVEVGTEVNTVSEARYAGQLAGDAIGQVLKACP